VEPKCLAIPKNVDSNALECLRLETSATQDDREHFAQFAHPWIKLAEEIEQSRALIAEILPGDQ
jgi:hypothetical protein